MSEDGTNERGSLIEQEYDLDEPPRKVWLAISIPEFRNAWLPSDALAEPDAISLTPGEEVSYRMREKTSPFLESTVTFQIGPNGSGGTRLRIVHEPTDDRSKQATKLVANNNGPLMRAA